MGNICSCTSEKAKAKKETSRSEQPKTSDAFEAKKKKKYACKILFKKFPGIIIYTLTLFK